MLFEQINHILLLGGSRLIVELALTLRKNNHFQFDLFTCERQLNDIIYADGTTLRSSLGKQNIKYISTEEINTCPEFITRITKQSLGIGLGEIWTFNKEIINQFGGKLIDLMGIRLPQYRGGAHYTWQILRGNRIGACNLQIINEEMIQGVFDSGEILLSKEYHFPTSCRIPDHYFNEAVNQEIIFIKDFLDDIKNGKKFEPFKLRDNFSIYFPRLNTIKNAFLDWNWNSEDIDRFICAFDDPYPGVSTFVNGQKVRLKKSSLETNDGPFHPFQVGLIYKIFNGLLYVATKNGTIQIQEVFDENGTDIFSKLKTGDRFITPRLEIESALLQ